MHPFESLSRVRCGVEVHCSRTEWVGSNGLRIWFNPRRWHVFSRAPSSCFGLVPEIRFPGAHSNPSGASSETWGDLGRPGET
jgi:hypothetical protein